MKILVSFMRQLQKGTGLTPSPLETADGKTVCDHHEKAALLLEEFKEWAVPLTQ